MGKKDIVSIEYFKDNKRFADLVNGFLYHGEQMIKPEEVKKENRSWVKKNEKDETDTKVYQALYRDLVRMIGSDLQVMLIAIEEQSAVHYAMPVRIMNADSAMYDSQWREIAKKHRESKDLTDTDEFISGFSKSDRLIPVVTIVIYLGEREWDGPHSLKELLNMNHLPECVKNIVVDYPIHILDVRRFEQLHYFHTDIKYVFGFLQKESNKMELRKYLTENGNYFTELDDEAYEMICSFSNSQELEKKKEYYRKKEGIDMCQAILDMMADERENMMILANKVFLLFLQKKEIGEIAKECDTSLEIVQELLKGIAA